MPSIFFILDNWNRFGGTPRKFEQLADSLGQNAHRVESSIQTVKRLFRERGAVIIITTFNRPLAIGLLVKLLRPRVEVIHNYVNLDKLRFFEIGMMRAAEVLNVQFVVPSIEVALIKGLSKYNVISNGVRFKTLNTIQSMNSRLFTIGGLNHYKNHEVIIKALPHLDGFVLDIYGEGPLEQYLRQLSINLGVSNRVNFNGYLDNDLVLFNGIYIHSSVSEGFGNAVCEAIGNGSIFLLSDIKVNRELFAYQSSVFFNPHDEMDLVQKIGSARCLNSEELAVHRKNYSLSAFVTKWKDLIQKEK